MISLKIIERIKYTNQPIAPPLSFFNLFMQSPFSGDQLMLFFSNKVILKKNRVAFLVINLSSSPFFFLNLKNG